MRDYFDDVLYLCGRVFAISTVVLLLVLLRCTSQINSMVSTFVPVTCTAYILYSCILRRSRRRSSSGEFIGKKAFCA